MLSLKFYLNEQNVREHIVISILSKIEDLEMSQKGPFGEEKIKIE